MSSLDRHLAILTLCADSPCGFSRLRQGLGGIAASTVARSLRSLIEAGLVRRDADGRYLLGPGANALACRLLGRPRRDRDALAAVDALASETGASAAYFVSEGERMLLLAKREVAAGYRYIEENALRQRLRTAFGLVLVAVLPESERIAALADGLPALPAAERATVPALVRRAARAGWLACVDQGGDWRLVAPVRRRGRGVGAVGISRYDEPPPRQAERLRACVLAAARRLSDGH